MSIEPTIAYRPRGRIAGSRIGAHPSRATGTLGSFRDQVPFMAVPDARRIDVRATLRDPFGNTFVRRFAQRAAIDVYALVDLSGSLDYEGQARKRDLATEFCVALARSAIALGDRFGLIGCDDGIREDCLISATKRRGIDGEVAAVLASCPTNGASVEGLAAAADRLAGIRKMVFLVSDFLLPLPLLHDIFERLAPHDIVPIVIGDSSEDELLPDWGLIELTDLETGARNLVVMRPALKRRWIERERERRAAVWRLARRYGRTPITIADRFDIDRLSHQLLDG